MPCPGELFPLSSAEALTCDSEEWRLATVKSDAFALEPGLSNPLVWAMLFIVGFCGVFVIWSSFIGAGWEPTAKKKVRRMLEMSGAGPSDVVYDLGSGDGRVLLEAAKTYHAKAVGVEADPLRVLYSRFAVAAANLNGQVKVVWGNFYNTELSGATIVTLFLTQGTNQRLKPKLLSELKPGTRVVSYVWTFRDWDPVSKDDRNELSMYVVPERPGPPSG